MENAMSVKTNFSHAELNRSYLKYIKRPMTPPPADIAAALAKGPIDWRDALPIGQRNALLDPGYLPAERGWCMMPEGSAFVAGLTKMPGVSAGMLEWWFAWHGLEGLRYAIWDPDDHKDAHVAPEDLDRRLNPKLGVREQNWRTTDIVTEDVGTGMQTLAISFMSPADFGYDMARFGEGAAGAVNANISHIADDGARTPLVCFTHQARDVPGGVELRSRFWIGWQVAEGEPTRVGEDAPEDLIVGLASGLAHHCPKEYHNLAAILPAVYAENSGIPDTVEEFRR